jgi:hypothetical protein
MNDGYLQALLVQHEFCTGVLGNSRIYAEELETMGPPTLTPFLRTWKNFEIASFGRLPMMKGDGEGRMQYPGAFGISHLEPLIECLDMYPPRKVFFE